MSRAWFDAARVRSLVAEGATMALQEISAAVAADARQRAPIRKVFRESKYRRRFRPLTAEEREIALRRAIHYYTNVVPNPRKLRRAVAHILTSAKVELRGPGSENAMVRSMKYRILGIETAKGFKPRFGAAPFGIGYRPGPKVAERMKPRALRNVMRGEGIHVVRLRSGHRVQMGGALKASIHAKGVRLEDQRLVTTVAASIYYAKFVEFPTIRTAAQPFLRPALASHKAKLRPTVAAYLRRVIG